MDRDPRYEIKFNNCGGVYEYTPTVYVHYDVHYLHSEGYNLGLVLVQREYNKETNEPKLLNYYNRVCSLMVTEDNLAEYFYTNVRDDSLFNHMVNVRRGVKYTLQPMNGRDTVTDKELNDTFMKLIDIVTVKTKLLFEPQGYGGVDAYFDYTLKDNYKKMLRDNNEQLKLRSK